MGYHIEAFLKGDGAFRLVPCTRAAAAEILDLLTRSAQADRTPPAPPDALRSMLAGFGTSLPDLCRIARDREGRLVGIALLFPPSAGDATTQILWDVDPIIRGEGVGEALLAWGRIQTAQLSSVLTGVRASFDGSQGWRIPPLKEQGFARLSRSWRMEGPVEAQPWLEGHELPARLLPWSEDRTQETLDAFLAAFEEHPRIRGGSASAWKEKLIDVPQFRPDLSWLALQEDSIVGFALNWEQPSGLAWIEAYGVLPSARGLGIGRALLAQSIEGFGAAGFAKLGLDVDPDVSPGALQLYEAAGLAVVKQSETYLHSFESSLA